MGPQARTCGRNFTRGSWEDTTKLQWGRRRGPAEGCRRTRRSACSRLLQWGRRRGPAEGSCAPHATASAPRFNGAAGEDLRKVEDVGFTAAGTYRLQWGRRRGPAEGKAEASAIQTPKVASMGPQARTCGRTADGVDLTAAEGASMGPQARTCGRSHASGGSGRGQVELQWGRRRGPAEGDHQRYPERPHRPASMGPQARTCGRPGT